MPNLVEDCKTKWELRQKLSSPIFSWYGRNKRPKSNTDIAVVLDAWRWIYYDRNDLFPDNPRKNLTDKVKTWSSARSCHSCMNKVFSWVYDWLMGVEPDGDGDELTAEQKLILQKKQSGS